MAKFGCTKSQCDSALKELQITLSLVRSNEPEVDRDRWLPIDRLFSLTGVYAVETGNEASFLGEPEKVIAKEVRNLSSI